MTSESGKQTYCPTPLEVKGNQTTKIGQLIELQEDIFFFKKHAEHVAGTPAPELFLFF